MSLIRQKRRLTGCVVTEAGTTGLGFMVLGGVCINCSAISRATGINQSYLSYILNGKRNTKLSSYVKIASAIGMDVAELAAAIEERKQLKNAKAHATLESYSNRIVSEDKEDSRNRSAGLPVKPRLPGLRII